MKVSDVLTDVRRMFLDSAPVIYFTERHHRYYPLMRPLIAAVEESDVTLVTSPVTLAECLVHPMAHDNVRLARRFIHIITREPNTEFVAADETIAIKCAEIRATFNLELSDAFQIAVARHANCDAFLTNDYHFQRIPNMKILILDELIQTLEAEESDEEETS